MPQDSADSSEGHRGAGGIYAFTGLAPISLRARAVIPWNGGIVVSREQHRGESQLTIPGGRVTQGENVIAAVRREVREETGLEIEVGPLLYVAEVVAPGRQQNLNLIFLGTVTEQAGGTVEVIGPDDGDVSILPPILDRIRANQAIGWEETGVWLGNVWKGGLAR